MSAIVLERDIIHYEALGRGRPVLFLHSWVGSWRYWIPMMQAVSVGYRAYALDLYGFGDTSKSKKYSLEAQAELIHAFLEEMGILRVVVVGHGLGAMAGLLYAVSHPGAVERVMVISLPVEENSVSSRLRSGSPVDLADGTLKRTSLAEPVVTDAAKTDPQAIQGSLAGLGHFFEQSLWARLGVPYLLVYGENDSIVQPPEPARVENLPGKAHTIFFDTGHFPMLDDSSRFARLMSDFLALASGESPAELQLKEEWKRRVR